MVGLLIMVASNALMLLYNWDLFTSTKVGSWSCFWNHYEVSGFDSLTYIVLSTWRPVYVLSRHPLLAWMMWPLSEINNLIRDEFCFNAAIVVVAVVWVLLGLWAWTTMYKIMRNRVGLPPLPSLLLTLLFYGFSHIMLTTSVPDHMSLTLPLLLFTIYRATSKEGMKLWQALLLTMVSMGVTTTNIVKVWLADMFGSQNKKGKRFGQLTAYIFKRSLWYIIPVALVGAAYFYQMDTTQRDEKEYAEHVIQERSKKDTVFAKKIAASRAAQQEVRTKQMINSAIVTNTEYYIDRWPSLQENIFGEGLILHEEYTLKDANRKGHRPVLVRYSHVWDYIAEAIIVVLFIIGIWCGRKERLMQMTLAMFLIDMVLHVGLQFASADVYIMTPHWAFVIPIALGYLLKTVSGRTSAGIVVSTPATLVTVVLYIAVTLFLWIHNTSLIIPYILQSH